MRSLLIPLILLSLWGCSPPDRQEGPTEEGWKRGFTAKVVEPKKEEIDFWAVEAPEGAVVREPAKIGMGWAPGTKEGLLKAVRDYIMNAESVRIDGKIVGLLSPHAGYVCSGPVAGYAYRAIMGSDFDTVVVLGTAHSGLSSVGRFGYYRMPFGDVPLLDAKKIDEFIEDSGLKFIPVAHQNEHCIELQIPFLCAVLKDFRLLPILISDDIGEPERVADAIAKLMQRGKTLLVISSDLSHWPPYEVAKAMDEEFLKALATLDVKRLKETNERLLSREWLCRFGVLGDNIGCAACGLKAIIVALHTFKRLGVDGFKLIKYANSYDTTKSDKRNVVGYAACAFFVKKKEEEKR